MLNIIPGLSVLDKFQTRAEVFYNLAERAWKLENSARATGGQRHFGKAVEQKTRGRRRW